MYYKIEMGLMNPTIIMHFLSISFPIFCLSFVEGIFTLVTSLKKCAKSLSSPLSTQTEKVEDSDFTHFFEDGTNVKIHSEIKPPLFFPELLFNPVDLLGLSDGSYNGLKQSYVQAEAPLSFRTWIMLLFAHYRNVITFIRLPQMALCF